MAEYTSSSHAVRKRNASRRKPSSHTRPSTQATTYGTQSTSTRPRGYPKPLGKGRGFPTPTNNLPSTTTTYLLTPTTYQLFVTTTSHRPLFHTRVHRTLLHVVHTLHLPDETPIIRALHPHVSARRSVMLVTMRQKQLLTLRRRSMWDANVVDGFLDARGKVQLTAKWRGKKMEIVDRRSYVVARVRRFREGGKRVFRLELSAGYDVGLFVMVAASLLTEPS